MNRFAGRSVTVARALVGLGLIALLVRSGAIEWGALIGLLSEWRLSLLALALLLLGMVLVSWRLCVLFTARGLELPLGASLRLSFIGAFLNAFLPGSTGGDVGRIYLVARENPGHGTEVATLVLADRALGLLSLLTLPVLVALGAGVGSSLPASADELVRFAAVGSGLLAGGLTAVALSHGPLRAGAGRLLGGVGLAEHATRVFDTFDACRRRPGALAGAFLISLVVQACVVGALVLLHQATSPQASGASVAILIPFGMLANALPVTPGGLGVGEAAFEALFRSVGASGGAETILAWRILTTLIDLCGGVLLVVGRTNMAMMTATAAREGTEPTPTGPSEP